MIVDIIMWYVAYDITEKVNQVCITYKHNIISNGIWTEINNWYESSIWIGSLFYETGLNWPWNYSFFSSYFKYFSQKIDLNFIFNLTVK